MLSLCKKIENKKNKNTQIKNNFKSLLNRKKTLYMNAKVSPENEIKSVTNTYINPLENDQNVDINISYEENRKKATEPHSGLLIKNNRFNEIDDEKPESMVNIEEEQIIDEQNELAIESIEEEYIPLSLARERIEKMEKDMRELRDKHLTMIKEAQKTFSRIEDSTRGVFEGKIKKMVNDANHTIKSLYTQNCESQRAIRVRDNTIFSLEVFFYIFRLK